MDTFEDALVKRKQPTPVKPTISFSTTMPLALALGVVLSGLCAALYWYSSNPPMDVEQTPVATTLTLVSSMTANPSQVAASADEPVEATSTPTVMAPAVKPMSTATAVSSPMPWPTLSPLPPETQGLIFAGSRESAVIALTFDVGETEENPAGYDAEIVRVLTAHQVPATFFLGGLWMEHNVEATLELARNPLFELGNHAWSHADFATLTANEMAEEIVGVQQTMWRLLGWQTRIFRFPYGTYNEDALRVVADHGLYAIQWDVVSGDPDPDITAERMVPWIMSQVKPGSIIIMHANGRGWHTAEALPLLIAQLREQGYRLTTVSEMLGLPR